MATKKIMKTRKIRNIDLSVCCGEQVIAYNFCFNLHINFGKDIERAKRYIEKCNFEEIKNGNIELVKTLINRHFDKYMNSPFIANYYLEVGDFFTL